MILASVLTGTNMVPAILHLLTRNRMKAGAELATAAVKRKCLSWMVFAFGTATPVSLPLALCQAIQCYRGEAYAGPRPRYL